MDKYRTSLILQCLIFLIPLNFYMWGEWALVNVQWALFRFQQSGYGDSLIPGYKDILYIYFGQNTGIFNIAAAGLWTAGTILLLLGLIITLYATYFAEEFSLVKKASLFTIAAGILFGLSALCRFNGGFAIPIGVPIILVIGWWLHQENNNEDEEEGETEPEDEVAEVSES
ncbi:MAG: hypothetical protein Q7T80_14900 [Methanoregula sp.]|nr:hypothetical protein [Methanoregula sp.]